MCHDQGSVRLPAYLLFVPVLMACGDAAYGGPRPAGPKTARVAAVPQVVRPPATAVGSGGEASPPSPVASAAPPLGSATLERPGALHHFFEALTALDEGRGHNDVHIVQFGDSHTAADYETGPLRRSLQTRFGDGVRGFVSVGKPWRYYVQEGLHLEGMSGWTAERGRYERGKFVGDGMYGLVGVSIAASSRGARAWTELTARGTRIELAYLEEPQGGSFDVLVDGVRTKRVTTRAPNAGDTGGRAVKPEGGYATIDVTDAPHRVELDAAGDGPVRVFGMAIDRPEAGLTLDAFGVNGARVANMLNWDEEHFAEQLRHRSADLVVLAFGTNESSDDTSLDIYERQLVDVLGRVARAVPAASCLMLGPPDRATREGGVWTTVPRLLDIIASQRRVAEAAGCAFYSQLDAMGGPGAIANWALEAPPRAMLDRTHLSRDGYAELGDTLAKDIISAYAGWRAETGHPATEPPRLRVSAEPVARYGGQLDRR
jgi:lysophospholipase L1-like esterase